MFASFRWCRPSRCRIQPIRLSQVYDKNFKSSLSIPEAESETWCMRVVITGHNGQLGRQLQTAFTKHETLTLDLPCDDITDPGVSLCISDFQPELVVHAAAFTDVDACEA